MRKYLKQLGVKYFPNDYLVTPKDRVKLILQRFIYGFDIRDIWHLHSSIDMLLYERLMMFKEVHEDLDYETFIYKGQELTLRECIDRILEGLRVSIEIEKFEIAICNNNNCIEEAYELYIIIRQHLWI